MGLLVDGAWQDQWYDTKATKGRFQRSESQMRNWITADGSAGPSGEGGFKAEARRYHLYVSLACPWAHRTLDKLEQRLACQRYLAGNQVTEADWRLFTTLVRFDPVYVGHFKCNLKRLADYPHLFAYTRELYQRPDVAETVDFHHIKNHYYGSHHTINPTGIVPKGPYIDWTSPHLRG